MLAASTPFAGRDVVPGGTVGNSAKAHLPFTAPAFRVFAALAEQSRKYPVFPLANAAIACGFDHPTAAGSTTLSCVIQPKYVWYAFFTIGSLILTCLPSTIGSPAWTDIPQMSFHG